MNDSTTHYLKNSILYLDRINYAIQNDDSLELQVLCICCENVNQPKYYKKALKEKKEKCLQFLITRFSHGKTPETKINILFISYCIEENRFQLIKDLFDQDVKFTFFSYNPHYSSIEIETNSNRNVLIESCLFSTVWKEYNPIQKVEFCKSLLDKKIINQSQFLDHCKNKFKSYSINSNHYLLINQLIYLFPKLDISLLSLIELSFKNNDVKSIELFLESGYQYTRKDIEQLIDMDCITVILRYMNKHKISLNKVQLFFKKWKTILENSFNNYYKFKEPIWRGYLIHFKNHFKQHHYLYDVVKRLVEEVNSVKSQVQISCSNYFSDDCIKYVLLPYII